MRGLTLTLAWVVCMIGGAVVGLIIGYIIWKLGFELIGGAVALVGAAVGGIIAFLAYLQWAEDRSE